MFIQRRMSPELKQALSSIPANLRAEVERVFEEHARLLEIGERDRQIVLVTIDRVGVRFDELTEVPKIAAERVSRALEETISDGA
jgi:hypothetical protein